MRVPHPLFGNAPSPEKVDSKPIDYIRLSSINSIGSAHADRSCAPSASPVSTPDRMLLIIGHSQERRFLESIRHFHGRATNLSRCLPFAFLKNRMLRRFSAQAPSGRATPFWLGYVLASFVQAYLAHLVDTWQRSFAHAALKFFANKRTLMWVKMSKWRV